MQKNQLKSKLSMLTQLYVKNYRSIEEITLNFAPLTILVGPNGVGKSNIIDVLCFVRDALRLGLENAILNRQGIDALRRWSPTEESCDIHIGLIFRISGELVRYNISLGSVGHGECVVKHEKCSGTQQGKTFGYEIKNGHWIQRLHYDEQPVGREFYHGSPPEEAIPPESQSFLFLTQAVFAPFASIQRFIRNMGFYSIYPEHLREPQKHAPPYPLNERAQNLASVLKSMKQENPAIFTSLLETLSLAVEDITDITVTEVGGYLVTYLYHGAKEPAFPLAQESDGTLRLLGTLTALYQFPPRALLALEEPELTVHPGALSVLQDALLEVSERTQLLVTTHSPDLLYNLPVESLRVVEKIDNITVVGEVAGEQQQAIAQKLFSPGELMRMEGLRRAENDRESEYSA